MSEDIVYQDNKDTAVKWVFKKKTNQSLLSNDRFVSKIDNEFS